MKIVKLITSENYSKHYLNVKVGSMDDLENEIIKFLKGCCKYKHLNIDRNKKNIHVSKPKQFFPEEVDEWVPMYDFLKKDFKEVKDMHHLAIFCK